MVAFPLSTWEDEGGPAYERVNHEPAFAALDWAAFSARFYPDRRRHDFEAIKAYEAYRGRSALELLGPS